MEWHVMFIELDDHLNECGCCPFIGLRNIVAAVKGKPQLPCAKFDIKTTNCTK